jgi:hypothetical protein
MTISICSSTLIFYIRDIFIASIMICDLSEGYEYFFLFLSSQMHASLISFLFAHITLSFVIAKHEISYSEYVFGKLI